MSVGKGVGSPTVGGVVGRSLLESVRCCRFFEVFVYLLSALIVHVHRPIAKRALRVDKRDSEQYLAKVYEP
jgi:hypothetical protein